MTKTTIRHRRNGTPIGDPENKNHERAQDALKALRTFQEATGLGAADGLDTAILDLLCNLAHFCDASSLHFADLLTQARNHYEAETSAANAREVNGAQFAGIAATPEESVVMTELTKPVVRKSPVMYRGRALVISMHPGYLRIREQGRRTAIDVDYRSILDLGFKQLARAAAADKAAARAAKKKAR